MKKTELAKLKRDAERYQFLKRHSRPTTWHQEDYWPKCIPMRPLSSWTPICIGGAVEGHKPRSFDAAVDYEMRRCK